MKWVVTIGFMFIVMMTFAACSSGGANTASGESGSASDAAEQSDGAESEASTAHEMLTGECAQNGPEEVPEGPTSWMPTTDVNIGDETTICVWMVEEGSPVEGASVRGNMLYLDSKNNPMTVELDEVTTDTNGLATLTLTVPDTIECEVEIIVEHDGETYDWSNYPDELSAVFYPAE